MPMLAARRQRARRSVAPRDRHERRGTLAVPAVDARQRAQPRRLPARARARRRRCSSCWRLDLVVGRLRIGAVAALSLAGARGGGVWRRSRRRARRRAGSSSGSSRAIRSPTSSSCSSWRRRRWSRSSSLRAGDAIDESAAEFYALMLTTTVGMMLMAAARDLLTAYLSLETVSIMSYVLAGFRRRARAVGRGGAQVRHLRRRRLGRDALRHVAALRPRRRHQLPGDLAGRAARRRRRRRCCSRWCSAGRLRLQGRGGAVPHVVPRRLRRRADGR